MKKIYVKYKILLSGLNIISQYKVDGFSLKEGCLNGEYFKEKHNVSKYGMDIDISVYLISCINDYEKLTFKYFESDDFAEFEVQNKTKLEKSNASDILIKNSNIITNVYDLEKKLRLIFNVPLIFQIICIEIFDENKQYVFCIQDYKTISTWNRLEYALDKNEISNNSRLNIDFNSIKNTGNPNFDRAVEFYSDSFESEKISSRYISIFSSLEAIFNLDSKNITDKLACFSAKLLAENDKIKYDEIYKDIKKLYNKRSKYIHGVKLNNISIEDEKLLRRYTRKIIIAYWMIVLQTKKTAKQILEYLNSNEKLGIRDRLIITALNSDSFNSQQNNLLKLFEEYGIYVPEETKKSILSNC